GELADVRDAVLEQVADSLCALREQVERIVGLDILGEDEYAGPGVLLANLPRSPKALVRVRRRHADVDDRHLRAVRPHPQEQLLGVPRLPHDLEAGILEQPRDALA